MIDDIRTLNFDAKCADCGVDLPRGSKAWVYTRRDGTVTVRCADCQCVFDVMGLCREIPPDASLDDIVMELTSIKRILIAVLDLLLKNHKRQISVIGGSQ